MWGGLRQLYLGPHLFILLFHQLGLWLCNLDLSSAPGLLNMLCGSGLSTITAFLLLKPLLVTYGIILDLGNPLQYSCLGNPMDGGAWQATVHGVVKSRTRLSDLTFTFPFHALEKDLLKPLIS